jgi:hypothetical protein
VLPPELLHYIGKDRTSAIGAHQWHCQATDG